MTALIVIGAIASYFAVGALYARSQAEACYRRAKREWIYDGSVNESAMIQMGWRVLAWPYAVVFDAFRGGIRAWFFAPIDERRRRAEQLREDAQVWREKRYSGTQSEREMAAELARLCEDRAKEYDL